MHTSKKIKVYDENGDEFSNKMDQLAHQNEWDQNMHPMFIPDDEEEDGEGAHELGTFQNSVSCR